MNHGLSHYYFVNDVIRDTEAARYWSNKDGFTEREFATAFYIGATGCPVENVNPPIAGDWIEIEFYSGHVEVYKGTINSYLSELKPVTAEVMRTATRTCEVTVYAHPLLSTDIVESMLIHEAPNVEFDSVDNDSDYSIVSMIEDDTQRENTAPRFPIKCASYIELSDLLEGFPSLTLAIAAVDDLPFSFGDANRTLIDLGTIYRVFEDYCECIDDELDEDATDVQKEYVRFVAATKYLSINQYIDMEN